MKMLIHSGDAYGKAETLATLVHKVLCNFLFLSPGEESPAVFTCFQTDAQIRLLRSCIIHQIPDTSTPKEQMH